MRKHLRNDLDPHEFGDRVAERLGRYQHDFLAITPDQQVFVLSRREGFAKHVHAKIGAECRDNTPNDKVLGGLRLARIHAGTSILEGKS